jgi:hypothetical protein
MNLAISSPEEKSLLMKEGPSISEGLMVTTSIFLPSGSLLTKSHAAFSARVLDFG